MAFEAAAATQQRSDAKHQQQSSSSKQWTVPSCKLPIAAACVTVCDVPGAKKEPCCRVQKVAAEEARVVRTKNTVTLIDVERSLANLNDKLARSQPSQDPKVAQPVRQVFVAASRPRRHVPHIRTRKLLEARGRLLKHHQHTCSLQPLKPLPALPVSAEGKEFVREKMERIKHFICHTSTLCSQRLSAFITH